MVQHCPRWGLNVLGVAVVTTSPHKLHQPAIRLALQRHLQTLAKHQFFCLLVTVKQHLFQSLVLVVKQEGAAAEG